MYLSRLFVLLLLLLPLSVMAGGQNEVTEEEQYRQWAQTFWHSLDRLTGEIKLDNAVATLNVPQEFYYLSPDDAKRVLEEVWGNPPGQKTLGMLFPADMTPFDQGSWAVTIEYEEDGYVSDEDADEINYADLLVQMQAETREASAQRVKQGYQPIELIGWAAPPYYDKSSHKLHWAKEIKFGDMQVNTLNYNIRVLGRKGVLVLNFIAQMDQQELIEANLGSVLALAEFDAGSRYADFDPQIDEVAAYGLGALVAGKMIAKTGFFAAALMFLKKFGVIILVSVLAFLKGLLSRKKA